MIGYDLKRGTLLIRDPTLPADAEVLAEPFLARYRSVGPRGMAVIPRDRCPDRTTGSTCPSLLSTTITFGCRSRFEDHDRDRAMQAHTNHCNELPPATASS